MKQTRVAVVAVHGIGPAQRYALQDEFAENLAAVLPGTWEKAAFFPPAPDGFDEGRTGSALRLAPVDDEARAHGAVFDVYEGYWSPIDKNHTTVASVISWLFNALFAPLNAITPLPAHGKKLAFDLSYVGAAIGLVFLLPVLALTVFAGSYVDIASDRFAHRELSLFRAILVARHELRALTYGFDLTYITMMTIGAIGWYIIAHVLASWLFARKREPGAGKLSRFRWQRKMRIIATAVGAAFVSVPWWLPQAIHAPFSLHWEPLLLLCVAVLVRLAFALAIDFFVNRMGDIQIYTTADYNSRHYYLRDAILNAVSGVLQSVVGAGGGDTPYYERVYVVAHSLGSTIAMDALIRLRQDVEAQKIPMESWNRIKAFVTLGTALEKTRFFFSARNPTLTESFQHWRDDVYGNLFTGDPRVLSAPPSEHRIFWANYWYFRDVVANRILTYRTTDAVGRERIVCYNVRLREKGAFITNPWVHSDYLSDRRFWSGEDRDGRPCLGVAAIVGRPVTPIAQPLSPNRGEDAKLASSGS